jgi:hypothetical protein
MCCFDELVATSFAILLFDIDSEDPILSSDRTEVTFSNPFGGFARMAVTRPVPNRPTSVL